MGYRSVILRAVLMSVVGHLGPMSALWAQEVARATVLSRDSMTMLVLLPDHVLFRFTEKGARVAAAGITPKRTKQNWNWVDDALQGIADGVANMRMVFPMKDVREVTYQSGVLTLELSARPLNAAESDKRGLFRYEDVPDDQARAFIREFRLLKRTS